MHRDLNPPNVLLSRIGEVKLSDFGIARAADRVRVTRTGQVRGKAAYMSPEQAQNDEIDSRTDLFALGLTLWESLTGRRAIDEPDDAKALIQLITHDVPAPSALRPEVPPELDAIVGGLLQRAPAKRTPSARALADSLEALKGAAAPLPDGRRLLGEAVTQAIEKQKTAKMDAAALAPTEAMAGKDIAGLGSP